MTDPTQSPSPASTPLSTPAPSRREARQAAEAAARAEAEAKASAQQLRAERVAPADVLTTMDDLFQPEAAPPRKRRRGGAGKWIAWILVFALVGGGGYIGYRLVMDAWGDQILNALGMGEPADFEPGTEGEAIGFEIIEGDSGLTISERLAESGITKTPRAFYDFARKQDPQGNFQPGVFELRKSMTSEAAFAVLADPANKLENSVLIREGDTASTVYGELADKLGVDVKAVQKAASDPSKYGVDATTLEGWLFPATYSFDEGTTPEEAIQTFVDRMRQSLAQHKVPEDDQQRILTIASIVQREGAEADFDKVARVIFNRLEPDNVETHGLLQMDSTAQYGVGKLTEGTVATTDATRADQNPYNTYVHAGLPAGPIANPGDAAIEAAMHPADGDWFYFVTVNLATGETVFSRTYGEQLEAEKQWHQWCADNPDSGCY